MTRTLTRIAPLALLLLSAPAFAHVTHEVGDGAFKLVAGYVASPLYTFEVEAAELTVTDATGAPVEGLEASLTAAIVGPAGATLVAPLLPLRGAPGVYHVEFVPTLEGNYDLTITGFIGELEVDLLFPGTEMVHADPVVNRREAIELP